MASINDTTLVFISKATPKQWSYVLSLYKEVFKVHATVTRGSKNNGPAELIKLDNWYQNELPKLIKTRREPHLLWDEIVQITKWKLLRGKFRPGILDLVKTNTETAVKNGTKKAFKKMPNINLAITALTQLKGIAPSTGSAILVAFSPEDCPFMSDEVMNSIGVEDSYYTTNDYLNFCDKIKILNDKLKKLDPDSNWNSHDIELSIWTHYNIKQYNLLNLLDNMPIGETINNSNETDLNEVKLEIGNNQEESINSNNQEESRNSNQLNKISNDKSSDSSNLNNNKNEKTNFSTNSDLNKTQFSVLEDNSSSFVSSNSINDEKSNESSQLNKLVSIEEDSSSNNVSSSNCLSSKDEIKLTNGNDLKNEINTNLRTAITNNLITTNLEKLQQHFNTTIKTTTITQDNNIDSNIDSSLSNSIQLNTDSSEMRFSTVSSSCENSNNINSSEDSIQLNKKRRNSSSSSLSNLSNLKSSSNKTCVNNELNLNLDDNAIFDPDSDQPLTKRQKTN